MQSTREGEVVEPESPHFSGLVFKLQANMDPRHRDKVAFLRVCSGKFVKGMKVKVARTGAAPLEPPTTVSCFLRIVPIFWAI